MNRDSRTFAAAWFILLTCVVAGAIFWILEGGYRAVSPLIFILGVTGFYLCQKGQLRNPFSEGNFNPKTGLNKLMATHKLETQKKLLWKKHIPQLIAGLYLKHIQKYPDWKHEAPEFMPESITAVVRVEEGHEKVILNLNEYEFSFKEWSYKTPDNRSHTHGLLEIFEGGKKVIGLLLAKALIGDIERWEAADIETFTPGPWLDDFKKLAEEILAIITRKDKESHEG